MTPTQLHLQKVSRSRGARVLLPLPFAFPRWVRSVLHSSLGPRLTSGCLGVVLTWKRFPRWVCPSVFVEDFYRPTVPERKEWSFGLVGLFRCWDREPIYGPRMMPTHGLKALRHATRSVSHFHPRPSPRAQGALVLPVILVWARGSRRGGKRGAKVGLPRGSGASGVCFAGAPPLLPGRVS